MTVAYGIFIALLGLQACIIIGMMYRSRTSNMSRLNNRNESVILFRKYIRERYGPDVEAMLPDHEYMVLDDKPLTEANYLNYENHNLRRS